MTDLRDQLQATFGDRYTIERELTGGGMSRVFLARETALDRTVVIKVLAPDLAAELSSDRFAREVKLAARLQDPHIVPVLAAGDANGLPYYTMPYVAGDSLRERLRRDPKLPPGEAVEILRGILLALTAAHDAGVVHRDIKPENVLLTSGGAPVVTDFGIAKAVAEARTMSDGRPGQAPALTQHGVSLGTPAYMSPEQAAGADVGFRSDLYSWGIVAYELLAGAHPFASKSNAQQLVAAQIMERPVPLAPRAPGVAPALIAVVERCLEKSPDDRPSDARDVSRAFDAATRRDGSTGASHAPMLFRWARVAAAAAVVIGVAAGVIIRTQSGDAAASRLSPARVTVLPFDNRTGDTAFAPLGAMAADWVTRGLSETGLIDVAPTTPANTSELARIDAARQARSGTLLTGTIYRAGDSVRIVAVITDVNDARVATSLAPVSAVAADPIRGLDVLGRRVAGALAQRIDPQFDVNKMRGSPPSFEAYRALIEGAQATRDGRQDDAVRLYRRAQALDTGYVEPVFDELVVQYQLRHLARVDTLLAWLETRRARLSPYDAANLDLAVARRNGGFTSGLDVARRIAALAPRSAASQSGLAVALIGANRMHEAMRVFERIDTTRLGESAPFWVLRSYAAHRLGEYQRELGMTESALRLRPFDPIFLASRVRALSALGRTGEVLAIVDSVVRSANAAEGRGIVSAAAGELLAHGHAEEARSAFTAATRIVPPSYSTAASLSLLGQHAAAIRLVDSLVAAAPATSDDRLVPGTPSDLIINRIALRGAILARSGDSTKARAVADQFIALAPTAVARAAALVGRAAIAAQLGHREEAVHLLRAAIEAGATFAFSLPGSLVTPSSGITPDSPWLAPLKGYRPFEELMRPSG